jgi:4-hydroxy-3-methylbut-2-enyl diphosphate reductase
VRRTGYGLRRSARVAAEITKQDFDALAVAGVAGGIAEAVRSGDVVVATEVSGPHGTIACTGVSTLAGHLRERGLTVHCGPIVSTDHVVAGAERMGLVHAGALAVDMESAALAAAAGDRPLAVVRVVVDTAREPLLDVATPRRALRALRRLRSVGPELDRWSRLPDRAPRNAEGTKEVC